MHKCRTQTNSTVPAVGSVAWVSALALVNRKENWASVWGSAWPGEPSSPVFLCLNLVTGKCEMVPGTSCHARQNPKNKTEQSCFYLCQRWMWHRDQSQRNEEKKILYSCSLWLFPYISLRTYSVDKDRFSFLMCQVQGKEINQEFECLRMPISSWSAMGIRWPLWELINDSPCV